MSVSSSPFLPLPVLLVLLVLFLPKGMCEEAGMVVDHPGGSIERGERARGQERREEQL